MVLTSEDQDELESHSLDHAGFLRSAIPAWPLLPVLQVYARDVPWFTVPHDAAVFQILWCPSEHPRSGQSQIPSALPWVRTVFHRSEERLAQYSPPEPFAVQDEGFLPEPCTLSPEPVTEYPQTVTLNEVLAAHILEWSAAHYDDEDDGYNYDLAAAPGLKLGGHPTWLQHPDSPELCPCGSQMLLLAVIPSREWQGSGTWAPHDELAARRELRDAHEPTRIRIGSYGAMCVYVCPASQDHSARTRLIG